MSSLILRLRLLLVLVGIIVLFIGHRYFYSMEWFKWILVVGIGSLLAGWLLALGRWMQVANSAELKSCWRWPVVWQTLLTLSLTLAASYYHLLGNEPEPSTHGMKILLAAWLVLLVLSLFMGIGAELAMLEFGHGNLPEPKRVSRASLSWFMGGMVLAAVVAINYTGSKLDRSFDWSYLKVTKPSEATEKTLAHMDRDLEVLLFFPRDNEILKFVNEYFSALKSQNSRIKIRQLDKDLSPVEAQKYKVHANGAIVLISSAEGKADKEDDKTANEKAAELAGETAADKENLKPKIESKKIEVGLKINSARKNIATLDKNFRAAFLALTAKEKIAYFSSGHGEADWLDEKDPFIAINGFYQGLKASNFKVKRLGIQEGSMEKVPEDATVLMIAAPQKPFANEEVKAIEDYLAKGGRLLLALDVNQSSDDFAGDRSSDPLLAMLKRYGLEYKFEVLADEQKNVKARNDISDRSIVFTNSLSSHESMAQLAKHESRLAIILARTGYFADVKENPQWMVAEMLRSLSSNFNDLNHNYTFDKDSEKKSSYILAAALTPRESPNAEKSAANKDAKKETVKDSAAAQGRIVAFADASIFADALITNPANGAFLSEAFSWLVGSPEISGASESEEDVKIMLKRDQELVFYYGTLFGPPIVVMIVALIVLRRPRSKREDETAA